MEHLSTFGFAPFHRAEPFRFGAFLFRTDLVFLNLVNPFARTANQN